MRETRPKPAARSEAARRSIHRSRAFGHGVQRRRCDVPACGIVVFEVRVQPAGRAAQLHHVGCAYCIVGHSERRHLFGERDEDIFTISDRDDHAIKDETLLQSIRDALLDYLEGRKK